MLGISIVVPNMELSFGGFLPLPCAFYRLKAHLEITLSPAEPVKAVS